MIINGIIKRIDFNFACQFYEFLFLICILYYKRMIMLNFFRIS